MNEKDSNIKPKINEIEKSKFYLSKSFYGALFFSIALWFYTVMNDSYQTVVQIPLQIKLPSNVAINKELPKYINVVAKGTGWNLMNLIYFNTSKICNIDLSFKDLKSDTYEVARQEIIKSIEFFQNVETREVLPESFKLSYGTLYTKKVKVIPDIKIATLDNFIFSDSIVVEPSEITIKGNQKLIESTDYVKTKHLVLNDLNESVHSTIELANDKVSVLQYSQNNVNLKVNIQYKSNIILDNIDVYKFINMKSVRAIPENIKFVITGGVEDLANFDLQNFYNSVKLKRVNNTENIYEFKSELPKKFKFNVYPKYIKVIEVVNYL